MDRLRLTCQCSLANCCSFNIVRTKHTAISDAHPPAKLYPVIKTVRIFTFKFGLGSVVQKKCVRLSPLRLVVIWVTNFIIPFVGNHSEGVGLHHNKLIK